MYKTIITYVVLGATLLGTASCGKNYCAEDYQKGGVATQRAKEEVILVGGTLQEVASSKRVPLDTLLEFNEFDSGKDPEFGDTICLPNKRSNKDLLLHKN